MTALLLKESIYNVIYKLDDISLLQEFDRIVSFLSPEKLKMIIKNLLRVELPMKNVFCN